MPRLSLMGHCSPSSTQQCSKCSLSVGNESLSTFHFCNAILISNSVAPSNDFPLISPCSLCSQDQLSYHRPTWTETFLGWLYVTSLPKELAMLKTLEWIGSLQAVFLVPVEISLNDRFYSVFGQCTLQSIINGVGCIHRRNVLHLLLCFRLVHSLCAAIHRHWLVN